MKLATWLLCLALGCEAPLPSAAPLEYFEVVRGDSKRPLPLIVAMHGRGGDGPRFSEIFDDMPFDARVISLSGPIEHGRGRAWFAEINGDYDGLLAQEHAAVPRIMATIHAYQRAHPTRGLPIAVGFSQGGMMTYELALAQPRSFRAMYSVAGARMGTWPARLPEDMPEIHAFHGTADEMVPLQWEVDAIAHLQSMGAHADLTRIEGAPHRMLNEVREPLFRAIASGLQ